MSRLIFVPQYPAKLRYQEWWFTEFIKNLKPHFSEILTLGVTGQYIGANKSEFAPHFDAIQYETTQIQQYATLVLREDDVLLLNDISYPGLFAHVLFHKRPKRCVAICHATSKNYEDYFAKNRNIKFIVEMATAKLFNKVFVGSNYHARKLGWPNIKVMALPDPPFWRGGNTIKDMDIVSVARPGPQKVTQSIENHVEQMFGKIQRPNANTWDEYYDFLSRAKILLVTSKEETYGYQVIDGLMNGCVVLAPNRCSYPELLPNRYLYSSERELEQSIHAVIEGRLKPLPFDYVRKDKLNFYTILAHALKNDA